MGIDWQAVAVALIVAGALFYVARRGLSRLRSFRLSGAAGSSGCETGCGKCGDETQAQTKQPRVVQISRERTSPGRGRR